MSLAAGGYTLQFQAVPAGYGILLDNVSVDAPTTVPETSPFIASVLVLLPLANEGIRYLRNRKQAT